MRRKNLGLAILLIIAALCLTIASEKTTVAGKNKDSEIEKIQRMIARWNYVEAIPAAQALLVKATDEAARARAHLLLARAYGVKGIEYRDAAARYEGKKHLEQAFVLNPSLKNELDVARLRAYLWSYRQPKGSCNQALKEAEQEIEKEPNNAQAYFYLGMLHHFLATSPDYAPTKPEQDKQRDSAIEAMKKATLLAPKRYEHWAYYITALFNAGQKEEALRAAEQMMKVANLSQELIPPSGSDPYVLMSAFLQGKESLKYLRNQAELHPEYVQLQLHAAMTYGKEDPTKCRQIIEALLDNIASGKLAIPVWRSRTAVRALYKLGHLYNQAGERKKALETYHRLVQLSPYYAEVRYNLGIIYRSMTSEASTKEKKIMLLRKAKREFEAQMELLWQDKYDYTKRAHEQTVKELEKLGAMGEK